MKSNPLHPIKPSNPGRSENYTLLTVKDAAARLNVSAATVYALIDSGKLSCHRIGVGRGVIRISEADITAYLSDCHLEITGKPAPRPPRQKLKHIKL